MKVFRDFEGRSIRLTDERWKHIQGHQTLSHPERVVESLSDPQARLYYRFYFGTRVGSKYLCVIVKVKSRDAFILTAYLTDSIKKGEILWPKKR